MGSRHSLNGSDHTLVPTQPGHSGIQETRRVHAGDMEMLRGQVSLGETWGQEMRAERAVPSTAQANIKASGDFPGGLVVDSTLPTQGTQVRSPVGELGSHMPRKHSQNNNNF